jgi:hypothetical protein
LEPIVVGDTIHMIEYQRDTSSTPDLALSAHLTDSLLETILEQPSLQAASTVGRSTYEHVAHGLERLS